MHRLLTIILLAVALIGCDARPQRVARAGARRGDEIVVCGQFFHTGTAVVLWTDPGGYNAYAPPRPAAADPRSPWQLDPSQPAVIQYGQRTGGLTPGQLNHIRTDGWDLPLLQKVVDQFVIHYDGCGVSKVCFDTLHERRSLSVHFMLDIDGTIYQTLDLKEKAWHATTSNDRSIGVEIANVGAYPVNPGSTPTKLEEWYARDEDGRTRIAIPARLGDGGVRTPGFIGRPIRDEPILGVVQGKLLRQYDLTPEQYAALARLTAALGRVFPRLRIDYPRDAADRVIPHKLRDEELAGYRGLLGHYHVQTNKEDPGPAFQWEKVVGEARVGMGERE